MCDVATSINITSNRTFVLHKEERTKTPQIALPEVNYLKIDKQTVLITVCSPKKQMFGKHVATSALWN